MKLKLAENLSLPIDVAGQTVALVGIRGGGKTNTAGVIAEELLDRNQPIVVLDPTDAWWGLRSGYPVFIFGGPHGDIPLAETDGKVIAEFVVTEQVPLILSLRHLRKNAQRRFVTEFCEELYHLKGRNEHRSPLTVIIDEAPLFIPQKVLGEVARTVGAVEDLIARGRSSGFGVVLISQRFATLNKDVSTQADTIITHRLTSPQDRNALKEWIEENATVGEIRAVLSSLATLQKGEAWVWAPSIDIFTRTQIRLRKTFDSSASPKIGQAVKAPKNLAEIDIDKLKGKLAATIEKAKADDPKLLRSEVAKLKAELAKAQKIQLEEKTTVKEVCVVKPAEVERLEKWTTQAEALASKLIAASKDIREALGKVTPLKIDARMTLPKDLPVSTSVRTGARTMKPEVASGAHKLSTSQQRILNALRWSEGIGLAYLDKTQLALMADQSPTSGGYFNNLGMLRTAGLIEYPGAGAAMLTESGRAQAEPVDIPTTSQELQDMLCRKLSSSQAAILRRLVAIYPSEIQKDMLAEQTNQSPTSGGYFNNLGRLRSLGLIDYPRPGVVVAKSILFIEASK